MKDAKSYVKQLNLDVTLDEQQTNSVILLSNNRREGNWVQDQYVVQSTFNKPTLKEATDTKHEQKVSEQLCHSTLER